MPSPGPGMPNVRNVGEQKVAELARPTVQLEQRKGTHLECLLGGSGSWIRTNDLRVMSPTSCHCSIPRRCAVNPSVGGPLLADGKKDPLATTYFPEGLPPQYRLRWSVSRPCSGWVRVGPLRSRHQGVCFSFWLSAVSSQLLALRLTASFVNRG